MNYYFIIAAFFLFLLLPVHTIRGTKAINKLNPLQLTPSHQELYRCFLLANSGVQMITIDLLLTAVFLLLTGIGVIPYNFYLVLFIALIYIGYTISWLVPMMLKKVPRFCYFHLPQWILFIIVFILIVIGTWQTEIV